MECGASAVRAIVCVCMSRAVCLSLDDVLWSNVLEFLSPSDLPSVSAVHIDLTRASRSPWLWRQWFTAEYPLTIHTADVLGDASVPWQQTFHRRSDVHKWARARMAPLTPLIVNVGNAATTYTVRPPSYSPPSTGKSIFTPDISVRTARRRRQTHSPAMSQSPPTTRSVPLSPSAPLSPTLSPLVLSQRLSVPSHPPLVLRYPSATVTALRLHDDTALVATDQSIRIFSLRHSASVVGHIGMSASHSVTCVDHSPAIIVSGGRDCTIRWYSWDTLECIRVSAKKDSHTDTPTAMSLSSSSHHLHTVALDGRMKQFDVASGQCVRTFNQNDVAGIGMLYCMTEDQRSDAQCITGSRTLDAAGMDVSSHPASGYGCVAIWDRRLAHGMVEAVTTDCGLICSVATHSNSHLIAAGGSDGAVRLFDKRKFDMNQALTVYPNMTPALSGSYSPPPSSNSAAAPIASQIACVHLDGQRLLTCQPRVFTTFQSSPHSVTKSSGLPHSHPVHSFTADIAAVITQSTMPQTFQRSDYDRSGTLAIAINDACLVWSNDEQTSLITDCTREIDLSDMYTVLPVSSSSASSSSSSSNQRIRTGKHSRERRIYHGQRRIR